VSRVRTIFLGTPDFAVPSLRALAADDKIELALVVTQPDRPAGRGRSLAPPPVKVAALDLQLPILQPDTLRDADTVDHLRAIGPDVLVVVAYGELLRRDVLELAPYGVLNVHPSLLPRYRGASPIPAAIMAGDSVTGVSIMRLVRRLDAGPILEQHQADIINGDTAGSLGERLAALAAACLPDAVVRWVAGEIHPTPQDDEQATYTREWTTADARIDWNAGAASIERLVRAANPWPVAWTTLAGDRVRVLSAQVVEDENATTIEPGALARMGSRVVAGTGRGLLGLRDVQPAGRRAMLARDWWRGLRAVQPRFDA
jgi:methionyl-tRNA formyltransferase